MIVAAASGYAITRFGTASPRNGTSREIICRPFHAALHADSVTSVVPPEAIATSVAAAHDHGVPSAVRDALITVVMPEDAHAVPTCSCGAGDIAGTAIERQPTSTV